MTDARFSSDGTPPRSLTAALICHVGDALNEQGLAHWLGSFCERVVIVAIQEPRRRKWGRLRREWRRSGPVGLLDALAFRIHYAVHFASADREWERQTVDELQARYPLRRRPEVLLTPSPNSPEACSFIQQAAPDFAIARCKTLLARRIFDVPRLGTFVMHPGICPEYRNSHGCFWALAQDDRVNVGMTFLRIDEGIDTGPVFGYFRAPFDAVRDSHVKIQDKVVIDSLDALRLSIGEIDAGSAKPIDVRGRASREWGQPRLSAYFRWRRIARAKGLGHASSAALS